MAEENRDTTEIRIDKAIDEIEEMFENKEKEEETSAFSAEENTESAASAEEEVLNTSAEVEDVQPEAEKEQPEKTAVALKKKKEKKKKAEKAEEEEEEKSSGSVFRVIVGTVFFIIAVMGFSALMFANNYWQRLLEGCPELDVEQRFDYSSCSTIYDANGEIIAVYPGNENIDWVGYEDIPENLINAFVAIEDVRFYTHTGIDVKRLAGAILGQLTGNDNYGASTITQQLVKNTHLTRAKTYERKAQEIHLSLEMEKTLSKEEILEWYLNILYLGESNYGIKNAAMDYFGKELDELSLREMACIAGLVQSPNVYNPRANLRKGDMSATNRRTNNVLYTMHANNMISDAEYEQALNDELVVKEYSERFLLYSYPTYVEYAIENVATLILERDGEKVTSETLQEAKNEIRNAGYQIYTAFDKNIQDISQEAVATYNNYPKTKNGSEAEVSAVIMDHHTGRVVAMIGGREEVTTAEGYNRATDSLQAVGSSMKPVAVYAPALEAGNYPGTTVLDIQEKIEGYKTDQGYPNGDYDNAPITMRRALEVSHNIAAVRFLMEKTGVEFAYDYVIAEGFNPDHISESPAGMALGASDVTTLEMTAAYATLANGGVYIEPHAFIYVTDRNGNVIFSEEDSVETHRVYSEETAWLVTDMMETNMSNGYGKRAKLSGMHSAGKTGTHEYKVISFGGYTPYYTSFLRISTDDYSDFRNASSYYQSAPLWRAYMQPIHADLEDTRIQEKTAEELGIKKYWVCKNSGMLAKSGCPGQWEYATEESAPTEYCNHHYYALPEETEENGWWDENGTFYYYDWVWEAYNANINGY